MKTKVEVNFTEYCDKVEDEIDMSIDYIEVLRIGTLSKEYKRDDFSCDIGEEKECEYYKTPHCPIYKKVPIVRKD